MVKAYAKLSFTGWYKLVLYTLVLPLSCHAQHEADNWFFGRSVGLSFDTGAPSPIYGSPIKQTEGTAVATDPKTGKLYFYTDGVTAWNDKHEILINGEGLLGSFTSAQSALILPVPTKPGLFYLFTTRSYAEKYGGLHYSIVDMALSGGRGGIISELKNKQLEEFGSEKVTAIPHANKRDFWLISHRWDSDIFLIFEITPQGISLPKEVKIGTIHKKAPVGGDHFIGEELGMLKASPDGRMLGAAVYGQNRPFELYDFDAKNGTLSNYRNLGNFSSQYSLSFSPDNSKLYIALFSDEGCYQFDLNQIASSPSRIILADSATNPTYVGGAMQLGPDGKLYMACIDREGLIVLNNPNQSGNQIKTHELSTDLKGGKIYQGLPNFIQSTFNTSPIEPYQPEPGECGIDLVVYPNPVSNTKVRIQMDSASWRIGCSLVKFEIFTISGKRILVKESEINDSFDLDLNHWSSGTYLLVFYYPHKRVVKVLSKI